MGFIKDTSASKLKCREGKKVRAFQALDRSKANFLMAIDALEVLKVYDSIINCLNSKTAYNQLQVKSIKKLICIEEPKKCINEF